MNAKPVIFVVDDDAGVRESLALLLELEDMVVETHATAASLLAADLTRYGCAIVDIRMPEMDGMQLQGELALRGITLPIIFLTGYGDIQLCVRAMKSGAVDFLTKPVTATLLLETVRHALEQCARTQEKAAEFQTLAERLANLTQREREVMALVIEDLPNKEIARRLDISHRTVEIHKARIMFKTGTKSIIELARLAEADEQNNQ